jgi:hypothetical protein
VFLESALHFATLSFAEAWTEEVEGTTTTIHVLKLN